MGHGHQKNREFFVLVPQKCQPHCSRQLVVFLKLIWDTALLWDTRLMSPKQTLHATLLWYCYYRRWDQPATVLPCNAGISTWKGQDQGQSLAVCLWNRKTHFIQGMTLISRSCLNQHLSDLLVQVNHLGILLKCIVWFRVWSVALDSTFTTSPQVMLMLPVLGLCFEHKELERCVEKESEANFCSGESGPRLISNVRHGSGASCEYMPSSPYKSLCWKLFKTVEKICYTVESYASMKMGLYVLDGINSKI